jgi:hypothetical protein
MFVWVEFPFRWGMDIARMDTILRFRMAIYFMAGFSYGAAIYSVVTYWQTLKWSEIAVPAICGTVFSACV